MVAMYGLICIAYFCFFLKAFWKELVRLHETLLQKTFNRFISYHLKSKQSQAGKTSVPGTRSPFFAKAALFPVTWRSTWLSLVLRSDDLDTFNLLKEIAIKTGLLRFSLASTTSNEKSMRENFQVLAILDHEDQAFELLERIPIGSGAWLEELHPACLKTEKISYFVIKNLIASRRFDAAKHILDLQPYEICPRLLATLVPLGHEAMAVAFTFASERSLSIQMEFVREIIKTESFEIYLLKYRSRFSADVREVIDSSLDSSHWWLAHVTKPAIYEKHRAIFSLDWYFDSQKVPDQNILPEESLETVLIAS